MKSEAKSSRMKETVTVDEETNKRAQDERTTPHRNDAHPKHKTA